MADIRTQLAQLTSNGTISQIAANPRLQFGTPSQPLVGATLLPERTVESNAFREDNIQYRTVVANDGTRYSPTQKKGGALVGGFDVVLAEQDIASELTSRDLDALRGLLNRNMDLQAAATIIRFLDVTVARALAVKSEVQRWQAIVNALVPLRGDNDYREDVAYSNPASHRVAAGAPWSTDTTDIFAQISERADFLAGKGFTVSRIITSRAVVSIMAGNDTVRSRTGFATINAAGDLQGNSGRATQDAINNRLSQDGLPVIEIYDQQYRTMTGTQFFLPRGVMVFVGTTGRDDQIDLGDGAIRQLPNTLGYTAIGVAAGQSAPGRVVRAEYHENKPPRIEAEGWQTSLPVINEPEAIATIHTIT